MRLHSVSCTKFIQSGRVCLFRFVDFLLTRDKKISRLLCEWNTLIYFVCSFSSSFSVTVRWLLHFPVLVLSVFFFDIKINSLFFSWTWIKYFECWVILRFDIRFGCFCCKNPISDVHFKINVTSDQISYTFLRIKRQQCSHSIWRKHDEIAWSEYYFIEHAHTHSIHRFMSTTLKCNFPSWCVLEKRLNE